MIIYYYFIFDYGVYIDISKIGNIINIAISFNAREIFKLIKKFKLKKKLQLS